MKIQFVVTTALSISLHSLLHAAGFVGVDIKSQFAAEAASNGTHEDFSLSGGTRFMTLGSSPGVSYESNITTSGAPTSGLPVVSAAVGTPGSIVGTPFSSGLDDGRMGYQFVFDTPQRWVGVQRIWNDLTVTQFYDSSDNLLYEFTGAVNPFVGYVAETTDTNTWVKRVQIDGRRSSDPAMTRQVGYSDDLMYGTSNLVIVPEPSSSTLLASVALLSLFRRQR